MRRLVLLLALSACGGGENPSDPSPGAVAGAACRIDDDCASGVCEGMGCGEEDFGVCADARRACTTDLREGCACDGKTVRVSSSCPGTRLARWGACETEPSAEGGAPPGSLESFRKTLSEESSSE